MRSCISILQVSRNKADAVKLPTPSGLKNVKNFELIRSLFCASTCNCVAIDKPLNLRLFQLIIFFLHFSNANSEPK